MVKNTGLMLQGRSKTMEIETRDAVLVLSIAWSHRHTNSGEVSSRNFQASTDSTSSTVIKTPETMLNNGLMWWFDVLTTVLTVLGGRDGLQRGQGSPCRLFIYSPEVCWDLSVCWVLEEDGAKLKEL